MSTFTLLAFSRETDQQNIYGYRRGDLLWKFGSPDYGGWQVHRMPCASWKTSKACGIIQSQSEGLKTRRCNGINPSLRLTRGPENWGATGIRSLWDISGQLVLWLGNLRKATIKVRHTYFSAILYIVIFLSL